MNILLQLLPLSEAPAKRAWLDAAEQARLDGIKDAGRAAQFLAGHCLARQLAAAFAGGEPQAWSLRVAQDGRRWLDHAAWPSLCLSIGHTGGRVLAAVGMQALGVDVEPAGQSRNWLALAGAMFSEPERAAVAAADDADREAVFLQAWTLKEAWSKRSGQGLQRAQARRCTAEPADPAQAEAWSWRQGEATVALAAWPGAQVRALGVNAAPTGWRYRENP